MPGFVGSCKGRRILSQNLGLKNLFQKKCYDLLAGTQGLGTILLLGDFLGGFCAEFEAAILASNLSILTHFFGCFLAINSGFLWFVWFWVFGHRWQVFGYLGGLRNCGKCLFS
jgi:hypothetical protein